MHPVLFELPLGGTVNAYGTLILLGGLVSLPGTWWDAKRRGLGGASTASFVVDFWLVVIFGAAIGGRLLHVLTMPGAYIEDPLSIFAVENTGFVFFGSLLAIAAGWAWLARRHGTTFGTVCDLGATWMALGHAFGRLGCFFAGCCWGAPSDVGWAVSFGPASVAYLAGEIAVEGDHTVSLHPTQLYESIGLAIVFVSLALTRLRRGIEPTWRQTSRYAIAYGVLRTFTEMFRGDPSRGMIATVTWPALSRALALPPDQPLFLSISQLVALALVGMGVYGWRRSRYNGAPREGLRYSVFPTDAARARDHQGRDLCPTKHDDERSQGRLRHFGHADRARRAAPQAANHPGHAHRRRGAGPRPGHQGLGLGRAAQR